MTRINCIPARELTRQHLIAEYSELPRVLTLARKAWDRGDHGYGPDPYVLGEGHVRFFYRKQGYLRRRHAELCAEMRRRGYTVTIDVSQVNLDMPADWQCDWEPDAQAMALNRRRIAERNGHAA